MVQLDTVVAEAANTPQFWGAGGALPIIEPAERSGIARIPTLGMGSFSRARLVKVSRAIAQNELRLAYQPCIDSKTGRVTHLEALLRWPQMPEDMNVQQLVGMLEAHDLIVSVGAWVIRQACRDLAVLRRDGHRHLTLSVNVSHAQLDDPGLAALIAETLKGNRIPGRRFLIEMTETMLPDLVKAQQLVASIKRIGVRTLIDDFGMGFSNLAMLKDVPAAGLKIDRSYVAQVTRSRRTAALTESLIQMAHKLGIEVVAEGVETQGQARWLSKRGVNKLQGFHFSKAIDLEGVRCLLDVQPWTIHTPGPRA